MQLSADLLRRLNDVRPEPSAEQGRAEQRRTPRQAMQVEATLLPFSERFAAEPFGVMLRDVSRGGFGFLHHRPMPLGEHFGLLVPETSDRPIVILCTIAYWEPLATGAFSVGARFCRVLRSGDASLPLIFADALTGELRDARRAS